MNFGWKAARWVKTMPAGIYTMTVKKNGYSPQVETVAISDGERTEINIQLTKN
ncbi:PEGA domain-containing protein [Breznakibacter xylanolyticus]|uniref:PEGA domain-containing protein n=1 Tax=Breznakibacter xylanolyticus TaxID=990 RepID=A0A2W7PQJ9_9BACT|nr:PEGA domain-containing protein [Breznakibacter xylanolyticus]